MFPASFTHFVHALTVIGAWLALPSVQAEEAAPDPASEIESVEVIGVRERLWQAGAVQDVIQRTELVSAALIQSQNAANLTEALALSPGARISNECSMRGVKRLMLSGLRGEHTTILIDGLPIHTMLAGFYALDALPITGVERIEVARDAGASLLAPEAIGGTVNVISREATDTALEVDMFAEADGGYQAGAFGSYVRGSGATRATFSAQTDEHDQVDGDDNGVNESPQMSNDNLILRVSHDPTAADNVVLRLALVRSEIFGGPTTVSGIDGVLAGFDGVPSDRLFTDDDVRERYVGKPWETTEWIDTTRYEASASWLREMGARWNMEPGTVHRGKPEFWISRAAASD